MSVLLSLTAAVAYGISDFAGGVAARRSSAWPVALVCCFAAMCTAALLALFTSGDPGRGDMLWGALSGVGSGLGGAFLYRGLAGGRMGVVAPVSAVGAAVLPVVVAVVLGERPGALVWLGIAAAVPGIWLVSREPGERGNVAAGLLDGVLAGAGFGLLFVALDRVGQDAGLWPVVLAQLLAFLTVAATAALLGAEFLPRHLSEYAGGAAAGVLVALANVLFLLATHSGLLTVAAVITSLYPAVTILLAATVLREHIGRSQGLGLGLCGVCVAFVAAG